MKSAPLLASLSISLALLTAGCESTPDKEPQPMPVSAEATTQQINQAKMDRAMVPTEVRGAFAKDFPGAAIDNVRLLTSSSGEPFYQITFIKNGQAQMVRYLPSGATVRR